VQETRAPCMHAPSSQVAKRDLSKACVQLANCRFILFWFETAWTTALDFVALYTVPVCGCSTYSMYICTSRYKTLNSIDARRDVYTLLLRSPYISLSSVNYSDPQQSRPVLYLRTM